MEHVPGASLELQSVTIHGREHALVKVGQGAALSLLPGLGCAHATCYR